MIYSQKFEVAKEPIWIKQVGIPKNSLVAKLDVSSGYYFTLADYQNNLEENAVYNHEVIKVLTYTGITKASQILITYDTTYQKLKLHHLFIWRNGTKIDRTNDLSFELMNNEHALENGIYMGKVTAYDNISDVRKDDLIDFAFTLEGKNPIFKNEKYLFLPLENINPIDLYFSRILYARDKNYDFKCVDCDTSIKVKSQLLPKYHEIEISKKDLKASVFEKNIPSWIIPYRYFTLSSFKNWKDVNAWAQEVFKLSAEPVLDNVFKEIFSGTETPDERINKIINYVQDEIRYMGIETGIGSIKPFPPDQVVKQRFGDCKDKSLLLVCLLKKIGIEKAYPVLVHTGLQKALDNFYPSGEVFNHCIVKFDIDSMSYWIDPTITQQGGNYKNISLPDYGRALIIGLPSDSLISIPPRDIRSAIREKDELTMKSFTAPAELVITTTRFGLEADKRRIDLEQRSANDRIKSFSDDLKSVYPSVEQTADLAVKDDANSNIVSTIYHFAVDGFWKDGDEASDKNLAGYWIFRFEPTSVYDFFKIFVGTERKYNYALPFPLNYNYKIVFHSPRNLIAFDHYRKYDNKVFTFDEKTEQMNANTFQITYNFSIKVPCVEAKDFKEIVEEKNKIVKTLPLVIYFKK